MSEGWADLFGHPHRVPLSRSTSPADIQLLLGTPSATHVDRKIKSFEYWPEPLGVLWVFSWYRYALLSVEVNYQERKSASRDALPSWIRALGQAPDALVDFRQEMIAGGVSLQESEELDGWTLLCSTSSVDPVTSEAKFLDGHLRSLHFHWPPQG